MDSVPPEAEDSCKVCQAPSAFFGEAQVLGKHQVRYFRCIRCGFVQTETPFWLDEAYAHAITASDIGYVYRNQLNQRVTGALISTFFNADGRFLDYGGGYGMLVRMMRDSGFDFYRSDLYCENLFAAGFDAPPDAHHFELTTAFEVFEHLVSPREELAKMLGFARSIFFTTQLLPDPLPPLDQWWYYGLEHGQHVALHTRKSLEVLASLHGLHLISDGASLHLFTPRRLPERLYRLLLRRGVPLANFFKRRHSLLPGDFKALTGKAAV